MNCRNVRRASLALGAMLSSGGSLWAQTVAAPEALFYRFNETPGSVETQNYASNPPQGTAKATVVGQTIALNGYTGNGLQGNGNPSTGNYVDTHWKTSLVGNWSIAFW